MNTKTFLKQVTLGAGLLMIGWGASAQITGSQHDLTTGGTAQATTTATDQVCVFCHTPHGSDTTAAVPLWNKEMPDPASYNGFRYSNLQTSTFDSIETTVGSVSLACLSCHDGSQAMDVVLNTPGTGMGVNYPLGTPIDGGAGFTMVEVPTGAPVPMLGTDLTNDHPISMQYGGGGVNDASHTTDDQFAGTLGDPDFAAPFRATINANPIWWVDGPLGTAAVREKTDMLLYTRASVGGGAVEPFVECGSCHDPHNSSTKSLVAPLQVAFLRVDQTNSQICTSCHTK